MSGFGAGGFGQSPPQPPPPPPTPSRAFFGSSPPPSQPSFGGGFGGGGGGGPVASSAPHPPPAAVGFGAPAGSFGAPPPPVPAPPGSFGAPPPLASPAPAPGVFGFGSAAAAPPSSSGSAFGAPPVAAGGGGGFGSPFPSSSGGGFGSVAPGAAAPAFGSAVAAPSSGFGAATAAPAGFGAPVGFGGTAAAASAASSPFGAATPATTLPSTAAAAAAGCFGASPNLVVPTSGPAPSGGFGTPSSVGGGGFGAATAPTTGGFGAPPSSSGVGFGAAAADATGGFGAPAPAFGASSSSGAPSAVASPFGNRVPSTGGGGGGMTFGSSANVVVSNAPSSSGFGADATTTTTGFGGQEASMSDAAAAAPSGGGFGTVGGFGLSSSSSSSVASPFGGSAGVSAAAAASARKGSDDGMRGDTDDDDDQMGDQRTPTASPVPFKAGSASAGGGRATGTFSPTVASVPEDREIKGPIPRKHSASSSGASAAAAAATGDDELARMRAKIQEKKRMLEERKRQRRNREAAAAAAAASSPSGKDPTTERSPPASGRKSPSHEGGGGGGEERKKRADVAAKSPKRFAPSNDDDDGVHRTSSATSRFLPPDLRAKSREVAAQIARRQAATLAEGNDGGASAHAGNHDDFGGNGFDDDDDDANVPADANQSLVGTCPHMCPDEELIRREMEGDVQSLELPMPGKLHPQGWTLRDTAVKRFRRSAADFKLDIPELVRPPEVLERVCGYLEEWVMERDRQGPDPRFPSAPSPPSLDVYQFIWDRTRMVRKDFVLQNYVGTGGRCSAAAVRCHERIARWHAMVEHQLSHISDYVCMQSQQNVQELGQTMKTLNQHYDDALGRSTIERPDEDGRETAGTGGSSLSSSSATTMHGCRSHAVMGPDPADFDGSSLSNPSSSDAAGRRIIGSDATSPSRGTAEPEMRGLYILLTLNNDGGMEVLKYAGKLASERREIYESKPVQLALSIYKAKKEYNYAKFFTILRSPSTPYLFACIMFKYVESMRKVAFRIMAKTFGARRKDTGEAMYDSYPLDDLVRLLCFEDSEEAREACAHYGIAVEQAQAAGGKLTDVVHWRQNDYKERRDPTKGTVLSLKPRKMIRTIEAKLGGKVTRLAVCRGEASGDGSTLSTAVRRSSAAQAPPLAQEDRMLQQKKAEAAQRLAEQQERIRREAEAEKQKAEREEQKRREERERQELERRRMELLKKREAEEARRRQEEAAARKAREEELERRRNLEEARAREEAEKARIAAERAAQKAAEEQRRKEVEKARRIALEREEARKRAEEEEKQRQLAKKREREQQLRREAEERRRKEEEEKEARRIALEREAAITKRKREEEEARERQRIAKEEEERLRLEAELERKLNVARMTLAFRKWRDKVKERRYGAECTRQSLERIDPTFGARSSYARALLHPLPVTTLAGQERKKMQMPVVPNPVGGNLGSEDEHCDSTAAEQLFHRLGTESTKQIDWNSMLKSCILSKGNFLCGDPRPPASLHNEQTLDTVVILCKLVVLMPFGTDDALQSECIHELMALWLNSRLRFGEVVVSRFNDDRWNSVPYEVRTVVVDGSSDASACQGSNVALFVVPPSICTNSGSAAPPRFSEASLSQIHPATPRMVLNLNDDESLSNPTSGQIQETISSAFVGGERPISNFVASIRASRPDDSREVDQALEGCCHALARAFVEEHRGNVPILERISLFSLGRKCILESLWTVPLKDQNDLLEVSRRTLSTLVDELHSVSLELIQDKMFRHWPPEEFATAALDSLTGEGGVVGAYFLPGTGLPLNWRQSLDRSLVDHQIQDSFHYLNHDADGSSSLYDVIEMMILNASPDVQHQCEILRRNDSFKRCFESAFLCLENDCQNKNIEEKGAFVYLPKSRVSNVIERTKQETELRMQHTTGDKSIVVPSGLEGADVTVVERACPINNNEVGKEDSTPPPCDGIVTHGKAQPHRTCASVLSDDDFIGEQGVTPEVVSTRTKRGISLAVQDEIYYQNTEEVMEQRRTPKRMCPRRRIKNNESNDRKESAKFTSRLEALLHGNATLDFTVAEGITMTDLLGGADAACIEIPEGYQTTL